MTHTTPIKLLIICGPTASGKSDLALRLAHHLDAEIVNADSMQIYSGLDVGTAKPTPDQQADIKHHLIDVANPAQLFSAADFSNAADVAIRNIISRGKRVVVAGGTGLYIRALVKGLVDSPSGDGELREHLHDESARIGNLAMLEKLRQVDPELAAVLHPNNLVRIIRALEVYQLTGIPLSRYQKEHAFSCRRYDTRHIGISVERSVLYERIDNRVEQMMSAGLLKEVESLLASGCGRDLKSMRSIGYKEVVAHLAGEISAEEAVRLIKRNTRHYAKRQLTWFKADPDILWFEYPEKFDKILEHAIEFYEQRER
ncbi:MAG: tRNA (adenosine(37)-N6)-dimethylallyltransferase MiaA [Desulfuromonadaceae bacterium]|nr:tRNA (adenosine(37)-N6)-dimethylallyltransferase MiaA [Desulfuromonadaceae bacterium]MDD2849729.1 tRNA (adenosine(37)-N6)-dimethylallyltransferase MiaA [Desulfuromonadaceae bacterium]MDD4130771.1 tRNA (adenosine(37)-N6)-dimethylallyltransferase MiaA [Desulfuromonadaceae bacterium]